MVDYSEYMKQRSVVIVENIYAEDLFEWFYNNVMSSGGDAFLFLPFLDYFNKYCYRSFCGNL